MMLHERHWKPHHPQELRIRLEIEAVVARHRHNYELHDRSHRCTELKTDVLAIKRLLVDFLQRPSELAVV